MGSREGRPGRGCPWRPKRGRGRARRARPEGGGAGGHRLHPLTARRALPQCARPECGAPRPPPPQAAARGMLRALLRLPKPVWKKQKGPGTAAVALPGQGRAAAGLGVGRDLSLLPQSPPQTPGALCIHPSSHIAHFAHPEPRARVTQGDTRQGDTCAPQPRIVQGQAEPVPSSSRAVVLWTPTEPKVPFHAFSFRFTVLRSVELLGEKPGKRKPSYYSLGEHCFVSRRLRDSGKKSCTIIENLVSPVPSALRSGRLQRQPELALCAGQHGIRVVGLVIKPSYMSQLVFRVDLRL